MEEKKMELQAKAANWLLRHWLRKYITESSLKFSGIIRARKLPFETREEWAYWWLPEWAGGRIIRDARMTPREKERYTVAESHNALMTAGRNQILNYIGSNSGNITPFAQQFAVGITPINTISAGDTVLQGEFFRAAPSTSVISGTQLDLATFFGTTQGNTTYTNAGLFGAGASSTPNSGILETHSLYSYTKTSSFALTNDYLLTLQ